MPRSNDRRPEVPRPAPDAESPRPAPDPGAPPAAADEAAGIRVITLHGEIDWDKVGEFAGQMAALMAEGVPAIAVQVASPGGNLMAGLAIHDLIALSPVPVTTVAFGLAGSSAAIIFQAGHLRLMAPYSRLVIHLGSVELEGRFDTKDLGTAKEELALKDLLIDRLFAKRTGQSVAKIRAWCKESKEFDAAAAVKHGFADGVVGPFVRRSRSRKRRRSGR